MVKLLTDFPAEVNVVEFDAREIFSRGNRAPKCRQLAMHEVQLGQIILQFNLNAGATFRTRAVLNPEDRRTRLAFLRLLFAMLDANDTPGSFCCSCFCLFFRFRTHYLLAFYVTFDEVWVYRSIFLFSSPITRERKRESARGLRPQSN